MSFINYRIKIVPAIGAGSRSKTILDASSITIKMYKNPISVVTIKYPINL